MKDIVDVTCIDHGRLRLTFEGGEQREIDLKRMVTFDGIFDPLNDPVYFRRVCVNPELGTIVWPNGADLCPDVLYQASCPIDRGLKIGDGLPLPNQ